MENKQLPGLSQYLLRSDGEVISLWKGKPTILKGGTDKDGYRKFVLIDDTGSRRYVRRASLMCSAYHGPRQRGKEVRHIDGTRDNDAPSNLAWSTHAENCADKLGHGAAQRGLRNGHGKLTEFQARQVKFRLKNGEPVKAIANDFAVKRSTIYNIKYGRAWAWVDQPAPQPQQEGFDI